MVNYIKIPKVYKKIKLAHDQNVVMYVKGCVGCGKTTTIINYFNDKKYILFSGETGALDKKPNVKTIKEETIIIDDVSWITDLLSKKYIKRLVSLKKKQIIIIGRSKIPEWLQECLLTKSFILADERDFLLDKSLINQLFNNNNKLNLPDKTIEQIAKDTKGHILAIKMILYEIQDLGEYSQVAREAARINRYKYYNSKLLDKWSERLKEFLFIMTNFDYFDLEFAKIVTLNKDIPSIIEEARSVGDFIVKNTDGTYILRDELRRYLSWKQIHSKDKESLNDIYKRAAIYYEMNDGLEQALKYYNLIDDSTAVSRILIKNANMHPGIGHYFELRTYYFSLKDEVIEKSPVLMSGISMLYAIMLNYAKSEEWYKRLKRYELEMSKKSPLKKEAKKWLIYLDIALPHRGTVKMIDVFKNAAILMTNNDISLPEFSVTSNLPSIMNGGKDFCEWSKKDKELARVLKKPIEMILGKYGVGLVDISLAESLFEKGQGDIYDILTLLSSGYTKADISGKIEISFASVGIMCRVHVLKNQLEVARMQLNQFKKKAALEKVKMLNPSIDAMENWFNLLEGKTNLVEDWLENAAPNEHLEFNILDRYRYLIKVRSYLALLRYEEAILLIERLSVYFREYKRTYMMIENDLLKSIVQYRTNLGDWKETLISNLKIMEDYRFTFIIAKEGAAIMPLLNELSDELLAESIDKKYLCDIMTNTRRIAKNYPCYLKMKNCITEELTETEEKILRLYDEGIQTKYICEKLKITYNTLKYHNKNIYIKLQANNRIDAIKRAKELGLL